jgi:hypothetical protein
MADYSNLKINRLKLNDELSNQASLFASAAHDAERLHKNMERIELKLELLTDQESQKLKQKYRNVNPTKAPNETSIKEMIRVREDVQKLKAELHEAAASYRLSKIVVEAHKMRAETMICMAHNVRQEKKSSESRLTT